MSDRQPEAPAPIDLGYMSLPAEVQHAAEEAAAANRAAREAPAVPGVTRWRRKLAEPFEVEAVQLTDGADWEAIAQWCGGTLQTYACGDSGEYETRMVIPLERGDVAAYEDDYVVRRPDGVFEVRDFDRGWFIATYEPASSPLVLPADEFAAVKTVAASLAVATKPCGCGPLQPCAVHMGPGGSDLTPSQCDRLRHMVTEHTTALSAVRRALDLAAGGACTDEVTGVLAAARDGLRVLEGAEEASRGPE